MTKLVLITVNGGGLLDHLGTQFRILHVLLPAVDEHDTHSLVGTWPEDTPHCAGRGIVLGLVTGRAVVRLKHVLKSRKWLLVIPELKPCTLDDARLFRVEDLGVDLLASELRAFVLQNLRLERWSEVVDVVVRAGLGTYHILPISVHQIHDQWLGLRRCGA